MATDVLELRRILERRFPDAVPVPYRTAGAVATGVSELDRVLPGGGLPRGRLTVWAPGGGATALLRAACGAVAARWERAAWVDGAGTLAGAIRGPGPLLFRPAGVREALECAEALLRSGGFSLVVVTGAGAEGSEAVRLSRSAREGGGAFVMLSAGVAIAALRLSSRFLPDGYRWRRGPFGEPVEVESVKVEVCVRAMGSSKRTELLLPVIHHDVRLSLESGLADRRGCVSRA